VVESSKISIYEHKGIGVNLFALETQTFWFALGSCGSILAVIVASVALWQASRISTKQLELTEKIHNQQMTLAQRQAFVDLFGQLKDMPGINPQAPVWPEVVLAVNLLDLVGTAWESGLTDEEVLLRAYRDIFVRTYDDVRRCKNQPASMPKDGEGMLLDSRAATSLYEHLMKLHLNQNKPKPLKSP
jgi:hypothetical protein